MQRNLLIDNCTESSYIAHVSSKSVYNYMFTLRSVLVVTYYKPGGGGEGVTSG